MAPVELRAPGTGPRAGIFALGVLLATLTLYFGPRLARGEVLLPHTAAPEAGASGEASDGLDWWYLDVAVLYVPETAVHLDPNRNGWLATWTPHNGIGRPLFHVGVGPAFILARAMGLLTSDPYLHHTWMTSLAVILSALFAFGFLMVRGLHPAACLGAALALSIGPLYPTWPMIPLVQWGFAWAFAALLGIELWCQRRSLFSLVGIAFAVHGILLTGFLEHTLALGWMVGGWVLLRTLGLTEPGGSRPGGRGRLFGGVALAAGVGVLSVLPVYADLFVEFSTSTRMDETYGFDPVYKGRIWPSIFTVVAESAPGLHSFSIGATLFALTILGAVRGGKRGRALLGWYWFAWLLFLAAATSEEALHRLLPILGLRMSAWPPVFAIFLPVTCLVAFGVHDLFTQVQWAQRRRQLLIVALTLVVGGVGHGVTGPVLDLPMDHALLAATVPPALLLCLFIALPLGRSGWASWLVPLALVLPGGWAKAQRLVAWKARSAVHTDSKLSQAIRQHAEDGSRYVWVGDRPLHARWMPPNVDAILKTRGLQSYDHLPDRSFHVLVDPLRPEHERRPYIRRFTGLVDPADLGGDPLALAGIGTVLSMEPLDPELATPVKRVDYVTLFEPVRKIPARFSIPLEHCTRVSDRVWQLDIQRAQDDSWPVVTTIEKTDSLGLSLSPSNQPRLLFLSQQYHRYWRASAKGQPLEAVRVNDLYQGVLLGAGETEIQLDFRPWSPWIVVSQLAFLLALLSWFLYRLLGRGAPRRRSLGSVSAAILAVWLGGCGGEGSGPQGAGYVAPARPDVILLMADTFRADNLGLELGGQALCPDLDAFARRARSFTNARTPATWTLPSHASLFTGRYAREIGVTAPDSQLHPDLVTLAESLAAAGYRTAAVTDAGYVSRHFGMDQGFESFVTTGNMTEPDMGRTVEAVAEALARPGDQRPLFLFVQSYRAHSWTVSDVTRERLGDALSFRPNDVFHSKAWRRRFLGLLRAADHGEPMGGEEFDAVVGSMIPSYRGAAADTSAGFGRILELLEARTRAQETAIVFTSDHGEAFGLHGVVSHGNGVWEEQSRIPLLISAPWIPPGPDGRAASLIDLPRTLGSLTGIEPEDTWGGVDLLAPPVPSRPLFLFQTLPAKTCYVGVVEDGLKWIFIDEGSAPGELKFVYDLSADPLEERDLRTELGGGEREVEVRRALSAVMEPMFLPGAGAPKPLDDRLDEQLRGMGY